MLHDNSASRAETETAIKLEAEARSAKAARGPRAAGAAVLAMEEVEDVEDRNALRQSAKEQTNAKLEMANVGALFLLDC